MGKITREHTWVKHTNCTDWSCPICVGGLGVCSVCGGAEGTLTTDCCGRQITYEEEGKIYHKGTLDFKNGKWVNEQSGNLPKTRLK